MLLTPDLAQQVLAACRKNAAEAAAALSRAFEAPVEIDSERIETFNYAGSDPDWNGPGLILIFRSEGKAAVASLAASSGLLPAWARSPDASGLSKLATLAHELCDALLPAEHPAQDFAASYVEHLAEAMARGGIASGAGAIHCLLKSGEKTGTMRLVWPAMSPEAILAQTSTAPAAAEVGAATARRSGLPEDDLTERLRNLPSYARSLLRISVPVSVHLASIKQPVSRVLNIGPGTIIQFEKNCEQPLTLCVGSQPLAEGEAVKVGEKFGIKLTQMILPGERFFALRGTRTARDEG
jgi:flagellar motor switch protein FliN